jgi:ATP-dependent Lhr-like helicase
MLRDLGPLTLEDIEVRSTGVDVYEALSSLQDARRMVPVTVAGRDCWAAIEDTSRLRDALGVQPPTGVPHIFLEPVPDPLGDVVGRYARTHGPFTSADASASLGLPVGVVDTALHRLEASGRVVQGAFRRGRQGREWVDETVLRRLKRRSLANLRREIEPVDDQALARFAIRWAGLTGSPARGQHALTEALRSLAGYAVPASVLERDILPTRVSEASIDRLLLAGDLVWIGAGSLGDKDGKVALYPRDSLQFLWNGPYASVELGPKAEEIHRHLSETGASFFRDIYDATGGGDVDRALDALWELVWAGYVTNDTFEPVRSYVARRRGRSGGRPSISSRFPPHSGGRWSLTSTMLKDETTTTERHAAWAQLLLERHGVITRSAVAAEGYPGGFAALYPIFGHLEEAGRIRRGYFVEGLGGSQFALPGAVDRLRSKEPGGGHILAATDPASVHGASVPWPDLEGHRLARDAGAYVIVDDGALIAFLERGRRSLVLIDRSLDHVGLIGRALAEVAARHKRMTLASVNGAPASSSELATPLREWGFAPVPKGLAYRG